MKVGIAQINTIVGDLKGNQEKILESYHELCARGAEIVVFPELTICGYPPRDLLLKSDFVVHNEETLDLILPEIGEIPAVIGFAESADLNEVSVIYNSGAWCANGKVEAVARKSLLPTYGVFDEERYFHNGTGPTIVKFKGKNVGITICEDIWTGEFAETVKHGDCDPVQLVADTKPCMMINLSASPWHCGKNQKRRSLVSITAERCNCPVVYCNLVGGNDELLFDGQSLVTDKSGKIIAAFPQFEETLGVVDLNSEKEVEIKKPEEIAQIHDALVMGLRDYANKCGFEKALLGLSGGIDSSVVVALAVEALGKNNVMGISLPSKISSDHSKDDAKILAKRLGIMYQTMEIQNIVDASLGILNPLFHKTSRDATEENIQARSRGILLMAVSNKFHALLLSTGNKTKMAVGYCTLYGDMAGGLGVLSDLTKCLVYDLARYINREREIIPQNCIDKAPSAELSPDQKDEDSLPPYPVLDEIVKLYVQEGLSIERIINKGFDPEVVRDMINKIDFNEYKRKQAAPVLKITPLAFGIGRRMPIVQKYKN